TAMNAIANSQTAMNAIANSQTAMNAIANSQTAMNAIANSQTAMNAIANSQTAMNAIINSQTALNAVINSQTAMNAVINSQTALNAVFSNTTARNTFINSTALTRKEIPQMTSNTTPEGTASASSVYGSGYEAFKAFDKNTSVHWTSASDAITNQWLRYSFVSDVFIHTVQIHPPPNSTSPRNCIIQCSQDGTNWINVANITVQNTAQQQTFYVARSGYYKHWRLFMSDNYGAADMAIYELNFIGFVKP
ncbi:MAG: discoidin domain-containing protein, partial [Aquificaceae bacterium]